MNLKLLIVSERRKEILGSRDLSRNKCVKIGFMRSLVAYFVQPMVGATSRCYFTSRFGDSHGFVARKPWLSPKRLMLFFKRRAAESAEEGFRKELCVLRDSAFLFFYKLPKEPEG